MALFAHRHRTTVPRGRLLGALGVALAAVGCAPPGPRASEVDTEHLRRFVSTEAQGGIQISVLWAGEPIGPRLILVHGTPGSATAWADYLLRPPAGLEVLALDRPGFGSSRPEDAVTSLADQATAVRSLLPADDRSVVLVGHSLGGPIVARLAADLDAAQPGRITALVLVAASLDPALETTHPMQRVGAWPTLRRLLPRSLRNANSELMALKPELEDLAKRLPLIRAKVIIVHGTADELVPVANVAFMQKRLSGTRCLKTLLLQGRNHFLPWNSEEAVRDAIRMALEPEC